MNSPINFISIFENESCSVSPTDATIAKTISTLNPDLKIFVNDNIISFNEYTIGSIQIGNTAIEIKPRNPSFTLEKYFEMILFSNINNFDTNMPASRYSDNFMYGFNAIADQFITECKKLVDFGITGEFVKSIKNSSIIAGEIVFEKYSFKEIPITGIYTKNENYTVDNLPNRVIKSALNKLIRSEIRKEFKKDIFSILRPFACVGKLTLNLDDAEKLCKKFYSANKSYPTVLEYSFKILREMKIKYQDGQLMWYSFLYNSNDVFEKYVRKVISDGLNIPVTKWPTPHKIARIKYHATEVDKGYSPDIIIGYNNQDDSARAVLDVKNKYFDPEMNNLADVLQSADMYQLIFYCEKMKTDLGALIYPACKNFEPVKVYINGSTDLKFVLISINMTDELKLRNKKLIENIEKYLLNPY